MTKPFLFWAVLSTAALAKTNAPPSVVPQPVTAVPFESTIVSPQPTVVGPYVVPAPVDPNAVQPPPATAPPRRPPLLYGNPPTANQLAGKAMQVNPAMLRTLPSSVLQTNVVSKPLIEASKTGSSPPGKSLLITQPVMFNTPQADEILATLQIFPPDNPWHQTVTNWPEHPNSEKIIAGPGIGNDLKLIRNLDMSFILVPPNQPRCEVWLLGGPIEGGPMDLRSVSDKGPFPVPDNMPLEGWPAWFKKRHGPDLTLEEVQRDSVQFPGDRHAIVVDPVNGLLYEFFVAVKSSTGWTARQASVFDLKTNKLRPDGWASADAAGLPLLPAIVRYDELQRGVINHALRVSVPRTRKAYVHPARAYQSTSDDPNLPRMGERLRLRADLDESGFSPHTRTVLAALKRYGMFVADNGNFFALSIPPDERMPAELGELERLKGSDFEVVTAPQ